MDEATRKMKRMEIEEKINKARKEREERAKRAEKGFSEVIGIDLGTTYSCVGVWKDGQVEIIANSEGNRTTPSWVAFNESERLIGEAAKIQAAGNATNTRALYHWTQLQRRGVKKDAKHFPSSQKKSFTPEEISSMVLLAHEGDGRGVSWAKSISQAVVTCARAASSPPRTPVPSPAWNVKRIINEPTAAALAYGLDHGTPARRKAHATFKRKNRNLDPSSSARAMRRLRTACESAKRMLSTTTSASVEVDSLFEGVDFSSTVTRAKFESTERGAVQALRGDCDAEGAGGAKMKPEDGAGAGRRFHAYPQGADHAVHSVRRQGAASKINPTRLWRTGAAVQGAILDGIRNDATNSLLLVDVTPLSLGIETVGKVHVGADQAQHGHPVRKTAWRARVRRDSNNKLGEVQHLRSGACQLATVEVTFEIDANGILNVSARDKTKTGAKAETTISNNRGL
ncbi:hypothetical protein PInf_018244 [Phytophthora infestans]|nr:hypothetical protein PInf_018244 [Phytophthora infestans]